LDHRIPKTGAAISVALALAALLTFLFLNNKFEGPDPTKALFPSFELQAEFENSKKLPTKQAVLYKGISVGRVNGVSWDPDEQVAVVTFTLEDDFEIHDDAMLQIGERSLLGDPYLNLVGRGSDAAPLLESGDEVTRTRASVNFDEALAFLDADGRDRVRSLIETIGEGVSPPGNGERLNGTIGGVSRTVRELNALTRALEGQEEELAGLVSGASTVLSEIGDREEQVRTIVTSGRATLDALATNTESLDRALVELPRLLDSGRRSLAASEPLLLEARPLVAKLRALAPDLTTALDEGRPHSLGSINRDLIKVVEGLTPLREVAVPVLGDLRDLLGKLDPLVKAIAPAARNLVPALAYLTPRVDAISGLYALVADNASGKDSVGHYLRSGFGFEPGEATDEPLPANCDAATQNQPPNQGYCANAYPGPGDALDPQPFEGPYPRLFPCEVPSRETPRKPCE